MNFVFDKLPVYRFVVSCEILYMDAVNKLVNLLQKSPTVNLGKIAGLNLVYDNRPVVLWVPSVNTLLHYAKAPDYIQYSCKRLFGVVESIESWVKAVFLKIKRNSTRSLEGVIANNISM